jgi:large subunit ribosomal protein L25
MKHLALEAWTRVSNGTAGATAIRKEGCIPGILIGLHQPRVAMKIKTGDMTRILKEGGRNALVDLSIDGQSSFAMIREFTRNPVSRRIIHVDLQRISATEAIETSVPLVFVGQPGEGFEAYTIEHEINALHVRALPDSLPSSINVDVATIQPNHPLVAGDIVLPDGVALVADPTQTVAVLVPPKVKTAAEELEDAPAPAAAPAASVAA